MIHEYRGWSVEEKKMYYPAFPTWNGCVEVWKSNKPQTGTDCSYSQNGPENKMILEQNTGRVDVRGKKLFVGDIIIVTTSDQGSDMKKEKHVIINDCDGDVLAWSPSNIETIYNDEPIGTGSYMGLGELVIIHGSPQTSFEIIGNIHEEQI